MIGLFDGKRYRAFRDLSDFFDTVLHKKYRNWRFFAHFGGRFDVHFLFDWLRANAPDIPIEINCAGSCVIAMTVRIGENRFRFCDSYRLLQKGLKTLTHDFDVEHKKLDLEEAYQSWEQMLEYNEHDCRGLYEVLSQFFDVFDITSETVASHAMRVLRSRYLSRTMFGLSEEIEAMVRSGYFGGRCEIFRYDSRELYKYDVNSLFPAAMLGPVPVEYLCHSKSIPDDDDTIGFFRAEVTYPEVYLPALPVHVDKLYFPVGTFRGIFTSIELRRAIEEGAAVTVLTGIHFAAEPILRDYVLAIHAMKERAEREGKNGLRHVAKLLLNSLYGKFAQRRLQRVYFVDDGAADCGYYPLPNGVAWKWSFCRSSHILPHIAATITARSRVIQHRYLSTAPVWYTDTDSVFTDRQLPTAGELGQLKLEGRAEFQAFRLKEYRFGEEFALKGVPRYKDDPRLERELRESYLAGKEIHFQRIAGFLESVRAGAPAARRVEVTKHRGEVRDKRCRVGDDSRPWDYRELVA
jgi:hypothetical protein